MNKFLMLILLLFAHHTLPHKHELKLYKKDSKLAVVIANAGRVIFLSTFGLTTALAIEVAQKQKRLPDPVLISILGIPSIAGFIASSIALNSIHNKRLQKEPILIFDEEGFTYKKPMGLFKGRKRVRYLWKDVISHWSIGMVDYWERDLKKTWCYHIRGEKDVVKIDALELDIPDSLIAKVESLRMGNIQALGC